MEAEKGDFIRHRKGQWEGIVIDVHYSEELESVRYITTRLSDGFECDLHESEFDVTYRPGLCGYVNVYKDEDGSRFISDQTYNTYKDAFAWRDELTNYIGTVSIAQIYEGDFLN
jgi:hypothetical protein